MSEKARVYSTLLVYNGFQKIQSVYELRARLAVFSISYCMICWSEALVLRSFTTHSSRSSLLSSQVCIVKCNFSSFIICPVYCICRQMQAAREVRFLSVLSSAFVVLLDPRKSMKSRKCKGRKTLCWRY